MPPLTAPKPAQPGGTLTVDISADTDSLNPFTGTWSNPSYLVANAIFEPLASIDAQGIARPYLAESIMPTGDFMTWTITARPGVTFHDGEPLDAAAIKKNLDLSRRSGLAAQGLTLIDSIEVASNMVVVVKMNTPWATYPATLAMQAGYMAAPAMLDDPAGANATPIGTGPFIVQYRQRDSFLKTAKNHSYWRTDAKGYQLPYLDGVNFNIVADSSSRAAALGSDSADAIGVETPDALQTQLDAAKEGKVQVTSNGGTETDETVIALNTAKPPFDDPVARQSLAYAVDQDKLAAGAYHGTSRRRGGCSSRSRRTSSRRRKPATPCPTPGRRRSSRTNTGRRTARRCRSGCSCRPIRSTWGSRRCCRRSSRTPASPWS